MEAKGTALVTGASRGIGRGVAVELARRGFDVVATMRDPSAGADLGEHPSGRITVRALDVTDPATIDIPSPLAVLVNNAGAELDYLPVEHTPMRQWREIFETNLFGLVEVTTRAIPALRANNGAVLCNVGSSSILAPVPFYGAYRASKAAVSALGETLRTELAQFDIRVLEIMPGPIETDMLAASQRMPEAAQFEAYRRQAERSFESRRAIPEMSMPVDAAAQAILDAILDDDSALRVGCDPLSVGMLDGWRAHSDEEWLRSMADALE